MFNESNAPEFPHVRYKESGQQVPLCTADNLKALLKSNGYEAKFNKMTLEADIFKDNMCMDKPDIVRSELVSLTSIYSLPKSAIDEHFNAIASENSYHPIADWLDEEWDSVPSRYGTQLLKGEESNALQHSVATLVGCLCSMSICT